MAEPILTVEGLRKEFPGQRSLTDALTRRPARDVTAVPAMGVIAEAMVAFVLAQAWLEKFGGDSLDETRRNVGGYLVAQVVGGLLATTVAMAIGVFGPDGWLAAAQASGCAE